MSARPADFRFHTTPETQATVAWAARPNSPRSFTACIEHYGEWGSCLTPRMRMAGGRRGNGPSGCGGPGGWVKVNIHPPAVGAAHADVVPGVPRCAWRAALRVTS